MTWLRLLLTRQLAGKCGNITLVGSLPSIRSASSVLSSCNYSLASNIQRRSFSAVPSEEKTNKQKEEANVTQDTSKSTSPTVLQDTYGFELRTGPADRMPSSFEQATGSERAELEDPDIYRNPEKFVNSRVMIAPFGTKEKPLLIPSRYDSRMIGCTGRQAPNDHEVYYMNVEEGSDKVCPLCGQVFRLKRVAGAEDDSSHHHHH